MKSPRFAIIGSSGSGKSSLARRIAERLDIPRLKLDSVFWQPNWVSLGRDEFRTRVRAFIEEHEAWVIDGNYPFAQDLVWERGLRGVARRARVADHGPADPSHRQARPHRGGVVEWQP